MEHFNIDNFRVGANYVLEASAGTGKTYNIVEIVKKILTDGEHHIGLDQILIVTYTEKAAGELKDRIRSELAKAEITADVNNAPIFTIHAFCRSTIKEFGISARLPMALDMVGDDELREFAERYVRRGKFREEYDLYSRKEPIVLDTVVSRLCSALDKYYLDTDFREDPSIIEMAPAEGIQAAMPFVKPYLLAKDFHEFLQSCPDLQAAYDTLAYCEFPKAREFAAELPSLFGNYLKFSGVSYRKPENWKNDDKVAEEGGNPAVVAAFNAFKNLKDAFGDLKKAVYRYLPRVFLKDFYVQWQQEKAKRKAQTFNDMLRSVRESVMAADSPLLEELRNKYRYAIIDEFQDTNQIQFDIFSKVFLHEGHNLIVVGDPKQSIYSFQGADIHVYHHAKRLIEEKGGTICELNKNFRSSQAMVESCNHLFGFYGFKGTEFRDCGYLTAETDGSIHEAKYLGDPIKAFWVAKQGETVDASRFAKIAVATIVDCCQRDEAGHTKLRVRDRSTMKAGGDFRDVTFRDFVVLASSRTEMVPIETELRSVGIPCVRYKDNNLFAGKECADWIALLCALDVLDFTGGNRKAFRKALFTEFFGFTLRQAADDAFSSDDNEPMELIASWRMLAGQGRWEDLFDDIVASSKLLKRLGGLDGMQPLGIYKQIGAFCVEYLSRGHSLNELIKNLKALSAGGGETDEENGTIVEISTDFNAVRVMTMHASKGLQFPVVIAAGGWKGESKTSGICSYHKVSGGASRHLLGFEEGIEATEDKAEERKRLYYVGYTRAQYVMIIPNYPDGSAAEELFRKLREYLNAYPDEYRCLEDPSLSKKEIIEEVKKILAKGDGDGADAQQRDAQGQVLRKIIGVLPKKRSYKHSYSSLSHPEGTEEDEDDDTVEGLDHFDANTIVVPADYDATEPKSAMPSDYPRGNRLGSALHAIFEHLDFTDPNADLDGAILRAFRQENLHLSDEHLAATKEMVRNVLGATLPIIEGSRAMEGQTFKLNQIPKDVCRAEAEFNVNYPKQKLRNYLNGFIDLLFRRDDGRYCLLDWKSDSLSETFTSYADVDSLKSHVDEAYAIQRVLYSHGLIMWLKGFYPELSEEEIFSQYFGGIYYVFLRGCRQGKGNGIYAQTWESFAVLDAAYKGILNGQGGNGND